jgi:hypothetical protein
MVRWCLMLRYRDGAVMVRLTTSARRARRATVIPRQTIARSAARTSMVSSTHMSAVVTSARRMLDVHSIDDARSLP